MDDRMRVSDADREQVTARLREHFAEGRLTQEELAERITATLNAKTFGDLRRVMVDLPEPEPAGAQAGPGPAGGWPPPWAPGPVYRYRRGPRLLPLALFLLFLAIILPGAGWVFVGIFKFFLLLWLIACVAGLFAAFRFRRRMRRHWQSAWRGPFSGGGPFSAGGPWGGSRTSNPWHQDAGD
jgi:uncharacterized membrane protein YgcG